MNQFRKVWVYLSPLILLAGISAMSLYGLDLFSRVELSPVEIRWLIVGLLFQLVAPIFSALCWRSIVSKELNRANSLAEDVYYAAVLLIGKYVPGGVFGLAGRADLVVREKGVRVAFVVTIKDQLIYYFAGAIFVFMLLPEAHSHVLSQVYIDHQLASVVFMLIALAALVTYFSLLIYFNLLTCALYAIFQWLLVSVGFVFVVGSLDISLASENILLLMFIFTISMLAGALVPVLPAGIGVRDGVLAWLLLIVVPLEVAAIIVVLSRTTTFFRDIIFGFFGMILKYLLIRK